MTQYGNAWAPGLVLRSKPEKNSEKIIAFQGESYHVSLIGEFINGYSKVRVDFYEEDPCEGGSVKKSWEGWAKIIDDFCCGSGNRMRVCAFVWQLSKCHVLFLVFFLGHYQPKKQPIVPGVLRQRNSACVLEHLKLD